LRKAVNSRFLFFYFARETPSTQAQREYFSGASRENVFFLPEPVKIGDLWRLSAAVCAICFHAF